MADCRRRGLRARIGAPVGIQQLADWRLEKAAECPPAPAPPPTAQAPRRTRFVALPLAGGVADGALPGLGATHPPAVQSRLGERSGAAHADADADVSGPLLYSQRDRRRPRRLSRTCVSGLSVHTRSRRPSTRPPPKVSAFGLQPQAATTVDGCPPRRPRRPVPGVPGASVPRAASGGLRVADRVEEKKGSIL